MKALTARVADGGRLVTRGTHQDVGFDNWVVKRDWRRDFDQEIVREGWELFRPNLNVPLGNQPFPQNQPTPPTTIEPINLQKMVRSANGRTAFIAGTPTTLYRYYAQDEGGYFEDELDENYFEAAELGGNLVTASTGNYTITGLTVGQKYRWIPGAGETELSDTSSGALYSFSGSSGFENFAVSVGLTFTARTTSVSVLGASGPAAGALHELIEEEYCDLVAERDTVPSSKPRKYHVQHFGSVRQQWAGGWERGECHMGWIQSLHRNQWRRDDAPDSGDSDSRAGAGVP
jgi:hypothetical protein